MKQKRIFLGRFDYQTDLLDSLTSFCVTENIQLGTFSVIGALTKATMGYYHQEHKKYVECVNINKKLEIASCIGNISLLNNEIFVHAHITLADHQGQCYGGHLMPGSTIFAAEYNIVELQGNNFERSYDAQTGLNLWNK